jgi:hypothetical protein
MISKKKILNLKRIYYALDAVNKQILEVTGGNDFKIKNDILYQMLLSSHEMLIIDLASLYRWMCQPGGFFGQLKIYSSSLKSTSYR